MQWHIALYIHNHVFQIDKIIKSILSFALVDFSESHTGLKNEWGSQNSLARHLDANINNFVRQEAGSWLQYSR